MRRPVLLLPIVQSAALIVRWLVPPPSTAGLYAQLVALFVPVCLFGALAIRQYRTMKRRQLQQASAFQVFVETHLPKA